MECNGYAMTYMPEHHAAYANGYVYDHVLEAEKMLGRKLTAEEVVHHIDRNRSNNRPDNLMVFDCGKSHAFYHGGGKAVCKDGVWHCDELHGHETRWRSYDPLGIETYCGGRAKQSNARATHSLAPAKY